MSTPRFDATSNYDALNHRLESYSLAALLCWSLNTFGDSLAQVKSFGPAGMVILDHLAWLNPTARVITLDTDFLFPESYELIERVQRRYPRLRLTVQQPVLTPEQQATQHGPELWRTDPDRCCHLRKVLPLREALRGVAAWLAGLRRDQSSARANIPLIAWDAPHQAVKLNPLAAWTRREVWQYIITHDIPYNALHDQGYASIGCTHCTRPAINVDDERMGRWQGHEKEECGIHYLARQQKQQNRH